MTTTLSYTSVEAGAQITRGNTSWGASIGAAAGPISFGFRAAAPSYAVVDWSQDNAQEMAAARTALALWADAARITFTEVNPGGYTCSAISMTPATMTTPTPIVRPPRIPAFRAPRAMCG